MSLGIFKPRWRLARSPGIGLAFQARSFGLAGIHQFELSHEHLDQAIPALFLRADLALTVQPADVFGMEARKLRCFLDGDPIWQG